jgi:hypothetical protein
MDFSLGELQHYTDVHPEDPEDLHHPFGLLQTQLLY